MLTLTIIFVAIRQAKLTPEDARRAAAAFKAACGELARESGTIVQAISHIRVNVIRRGEA